jgi:hypothetical protein
MLHALRTMEKDELHVSLRGSLEEGADLLNLFGTLTHKLCINTRWLTKVNSAGIDLLLKFLAGCKNGGIQVRYSECSHAFSNYLRFVLMHGLSGPVESVVGPFSCAKCPSDFEVLIKTSDIKSVMAQVKAQRCPKCQGPVQFDELPEEYFAFLV